MNNAWTVPIHMNSEKFVGVGFCSYKQHNNSKH